MTITIAGHTVVIDDMAHGKRIQAKADRLRRTGQHDKLEQWLYAGAPIRKPRVQK